MIAYLTKLVTQVKKDIAKAQDIKTLELLRVKYLGKNGNFTKKIGILHNVSHEMRPTIGAAINKARQEILQSFMNHKTTLEFKALETKLDKEKLDVSLPGRYKENGSLHPISNTIARIEYLFTTLGFTIVTGPEIEDEYHNFDALNIPMHHPARNNHDTFWFDDKRLLRTQTSSMQIRIMKNHTPPIRIIASGRVYRKDFDYMHAPMFHQIEGLVIDNDISFANFKGTVYDFLHNFFEEDLKIRFRPSYFPFTEPSAEVDVRGKNDYWLEILGGGMVHTNIMFNAGINPEIYSGFSFGIGVERLTMLRYGITDLRMFFENDLRFLKQFK